MGQSSFAWTLVYEDGSTVEVVSTYDELWLNDAVTNIVPVAIIRTRFA